MPENVQTKCNETWHNLKLAVIFYFFFLLVNGISKKDYSFGTQERLLEQSKTANLVVSFVIIQTQNSLRKNLTRAQVLRHMAKHQLSENPSNIRTCSAMPRAPLPLNSLLYHQLQRRPNENNRKRSAWAADLIQCNFVPY
jgi:hypothetical protein